MNGCLLLNNSSSLTLPKFSSSFMEDFNLFNKENVQVTYRAEL